MNASEAAEILSDAQAAWPNRDFTGPTGALYVEALEPFDAFDGRLAMAECIETLPIAPAIASVVAMCKAKRRERLEREPRRLGQGTGTSLSEFLRLNPDYAERVRKLGWWSKTLAALEESE